MEQYIPKSVVLAEIKKLMGNPELIEDWRYRVKMEEKNELLKSIINTINILEAKEVDTWHLQLIKLNSMTDKEKFRKEVEKLKSNLIYGACSSQIAMETMCKEEAYNEVLAILDSMQEEPVSDDLEEAADNALSNVLNTHEIVNVRSCLEMFKSGAKWKEEWIMAKAINGIARPDDGEIWCDLKSFNFKDGDKVKVIVIKED